MPSKPSMLQFPYGLADFYRIRTQGYVYVDRTAYLRTLESLGSALLFLRPRRFGKSLWLQTLRCYYDVALAGDFDTLFGDLAAGREPTPLANRYFVLTWNFSEVSARGGAAEIGARLNEYVNHQIENFLTTAAPLLPAPVEIQEEGADTLRRLLTVIRQTPYPLYLLIDEYDNFINEVMVSDRATYRALVQTDGPFKELFKSVKSAMEGQGLERVFITGVSPVAMNDLSSGFNVARDVSRHPDLAMLCGFSEGEAIELLERMEAAGSLPRERIADTLRVMHDWYNGYAFSPTARQLVLNPTSCLHLLQEFQELGTWPDELHDRNLAMDQGKLAFLSRETVGAELVTELAAGEGSVEIAGLESQFSLDDLVNKLPSSRGFLASFLYYLGLLTLVGEPPRQRLGVPNLVVRKLYLDRLLALHLPDPADENRAEQAVLAFYRDGELAPLIALVEAKLLPALSNRDYAGMNEKVLKGLLLALLFDDRRYTAVSELEAGRGYLDLCLLVRPHLRGHGLFDFLFELKYVPLSELALTGRELGELDAAGLRALPPIARRLDAAQEQLGRYRAALAERFGEGLALRSYALVAAGLERLVGEEV